jgi:hypothetical protein
MRWAAAAGALATELLDRHVLLRTAEQRAASVAPTRRDRVTSLVHAADEHARVARDLFAEGRSASAAVLQRAALGKLFVALALTRAKASEPGSQGEDDAEKPEATARPEEDIVEDGWVMLDELAPVIGLEAADVREVFLASPLQSVPAIALNERSSRSSDMLTAVREKIEIRSLRRLRVERQLRLGVLAVLVLVLLFQLGKWILAPKNLARHATVSASSQRPGFPLASTLVNGSIESGSGFATNDEADPWVVIDLGAPHPVSTIKIYNRGDAYFDGSLPIRVERSEDGVEYLPVGTHTKSFSQSSPATLTVGRAATRYVRVHGRPGGNLCVTEIEIL